MATVAHTPQVLPTMVDYQGVRSRKWANMANGDVGEPIVLTKYNDRTLHVTGTFGVGGTVTFEGSNDGTEYLAMRDVFNATVSATEAKLITLAEVPLYVRPHVTAGDGSTVITVICTAVGRE